MSAPWAVLFLFDPSPTVDNDGDGFSADTDCNDDDPSINPGAAELCDGIDDDCDTFVDEDLVFVDYFADLDADGFGDPLLAVATCDGPPAGFVVDGSDCDDANAAINPGVVDQCNQFDEDCDGQVDEDATYLDFYPDRDHDDYGDPSDSVTSCDVVPQGYVRDATDCDDDDPDVHPGADDVCNGVDDDCDAEVDEDAPLVDAYADRDGDAFGDPSDPISGCGAPDGYVADGTDCDDDDPDVHPDAVEVCDTVDDDCDGEPDDGGVCDGEDTDDEEEADDADKGGDCGCDSSGVGSGWVVLPLLVIGRRRR